MHLVILFGMIKGRVNFFREIPRANILHVIIVSLFFISLTGCVSAKYKMAAEDTPSPIPLNIRAASHPVDAAIDTVIILGGPGSWKQEAYWDEYVLSVTNRGAAPVTLESASLIDLQDNPVVPGDAPWDLQEQSKAWVEKYSSGTTGVVLKVGAASVMTGAAVGALALAGGGGAFVSAGTIAAAAAPVAAVVALPIIGIGTILVNGEGKHKIEDEFQRRRIALPAVIQPDQTCRGSLFFRVAPGPKHLTLLFSRPDSKFELPFDLKPLADLHLEKPPEPKPPE